MDLRKIKKLMELVEESGISELEVKSADESIRISRPVLGSVVAHSTVSEPATSSAPPQESTIASNVVRAPMAGTFYKAPEPGGDPFVRVGERVEVGDVLCIIESMKMMNEIAAQAPGTVTTIEISNGEAVASEQVLFRLTASV